MRRQQFQNVGAIFACRLMIIAGAPDVICDVLQDVIPILEEVSVKLLHTISRRLIVSYVTNSGLP